MSSSLDSEGGLKSWKKQLLEYEYGTEKYHHALVLSDDSSPLEFASLEKNPLVINSSTIEKIKKKHHLDISYLINLEKYINNTLFAFDSLQFKDSKVYVTSYKDTVQNPLVFVVRERKLDGGYPVNEVTAIYDKKNLQNLLDRTLEQGGKVYINKEFSERLEFSLYKFSAISKEGTEQENAKKGSRFVSKRTKEEREKKKSRIPKKDKTKEENER